MLRSAEVLADGGYLRMAAELCETMLGDDRIKSVVDQRTEALFGLDLSFEEGIGRLKRRAIKALEVEEDWWAAFPESELKLLRAWGPMLGVGIAELQWTPKGERVVPRLSVRSLRFLRWDWPTRTRASSSPRPIVVRSANAGSARMASTAGSAIAATHRCSSPAGRSLRGRSVRGRERLARPGTARRRRRDRPRADDARAALAVVSKLTHEGLRSVPIVSMAATRSTSASARRFSAQPMPATLMVVVTASRRAELADVRPRAVARVASGDDARTVAASLGVTLRTVWRWIALERRRGPSALQAQVATGRPTQLDAAGLRTLLVNKSPARYGVVGYLWTVERVREAIAMRWSWPAHPTTIARALARAGLVPARAPRAAPSDAEDPQLRLWVGTRFARLVEWAEKNRRTVVVLDAISTPNLDRPGQNARGGSSLVSAFTLDGRWWFRAFDTPSSTSKVSRFLVALAKEIGDVEAIASAAAMSSTTLYRWSVDDSRAFKAWGRSAERVATRQAAEAAPVHLFWRVRGLLDERTTANRDANE
jgi:transposase